MPRIRYRVAQLVGAVSAGLRPPDDAAARATLPPTLYAVFARMPAADRWHALSALAELRRAGERDAIVLQAALLHDVGKADAGVTVVHRVARTLLARRSPGLWHLLSGQPEGWRRPFWAISQHPACGAARLAAAGADRDLVEIVRFHESPAPAAWHGTAQERRHAALAAVDART